MTDLDQTRRFLGQIPALASRLPEFLTGTTPKGDEAGNKRLPARSKPPVSLELLDLIDGRDIEWWTMLALDEMIESSIEPTDAPSSRQPSIADNCEFLNHHADWIAQHNDDFQTEIQALYWSYRRAAGDQPGPRINCVECRGEAFIDSIWLVCREVEDHARTIKSIENEHRRRPPQPASELIEEFKVKPEKLRTLEIAGKHRDGKRGRPENLYLPWDVFRVANPLVAEALDARDEFVAKEMRTAS